MKFILFSLLLIAVPAWLYLVVGINTYVIPISDYAFSPLSLAGYILTPITAIYEVFKHVKKTNNK
ncbi:MAG: hypothetical protein J7K23_01005 [Thermoproteales archaeon]|nr:hypothetical protein [Thermoproteales archaeon]